MAPFRSIATSLTAFATSRQQHQCTRGPSICSSRSNFETRIDMFDVANSQLNRPTNTHKSFNYRSRSNTSPLYATPTVTAAAALIKSTPLVLGLEMKAIGYMGLLALQFGLQPSLTRKCTPKSVNRSTVIFTQDMVKFVMAFATLQITGGWSHAIVGWNVSTWLTVAGVPAILYCIQNYSTLVAYQNLSPLTFNVLNQTKTLSAALCCFLLMGKVQSVMQIVSLLILFGSACIIEKILPLRFWTIGKGKKKNNADTSKADMEATEEASESVSDSEDNHTQGLIAVLLASLISGLAGALTQKNLQNTVGSASGGRNSYLFTMELCVISLVSTTISMLRSEDGAKIKSNGFFHQWTPQTIIPIMTNAAGGIVVGLVTKYAGSVRKGFALIFGLLLSGILQALFEKDGHISFEQVVGGCLAAFSLWMHSAFPVIAK